MRDLKLAIKVMLVAVESGWLDLKLEKRALVYYSINA